MCSESTKIMPGQRWGFSARIEREKSGMSNVYCVKCKQKTEQKDAQRITMKNGKPAQQGSCAVCGTKTTLILSAAKA
jgi:hypothetical protein